jgi:hypothetical protein
LIRATVLTMPPRRDDSARVYQALLRVAAVIHPDWENRRVGSLDPRGYFPFWRGVGPCPGERDLVLWLKLVHPAVAEAVKAAIVNCRARSPKRWKPNGGATIEGGDRACPT